MTLSNRSLIAGAAAVGTLAALCLLVDLPAGPTDEGSTPRAAPDAARSSRTLGTRTQTAQASAADAPDARQAPATYASDRVIVSAGDAETLAAVARRLQTRVAQAPGASGYGALAVPAGTELRVFLRQVRADAAVVDVAPEGIMRGAAKGGSKGGTTLLDTTSEASSDSTSTAGTLEQALRWHLDAAGVPSTVPAGIGDVVVAVLDSGAATETIIDQDVLRQATSSLSPVAIVAPHDFVEGDSLPQDAHQHGTHIASLILGQGDRPGVSPGAQLMPVRVLDAANEGRELDLVDGIHWAIDHGADVINLSLSFNLDYVPSWALQSALAEAKAAGIMVIAAVGNSGEERISWPAASRAVIAVGAAAPSSNNPYPADYSNHDQRVDLLAPGGLINEDGNGDGLPDGLPAETFHPDSPDQPQLWLMAGSSQAAAMASGAAAWLLATGATAEQVEQAMLQTAVSVGGIPYSNGAGAGALDLAAAHAWIQAGGVPPSHDLHVSVLPFLLAKGGNIEANAIVQVFDDTGATPGRVVVMGRIFSTSGITAYETTTSSKDSRGWAVAESIPATAEAQAWGFSVDLIVHGDHVHRPDGAIHASDGLEILTASIASRPELADACLAVHWEEGSAIDAIGPTKRSLTLTNMGTGLSSSPLGVVLNGPAMDQWSTAATVEVDLDGSGLSSSPLGLMPLQLRSLDGSGLSSSPLGLQSSLQVLSFEGSGLSSSPLGMTGPSLLLDDDSIDSALIDIPSEPIFLGEGTAATADLSGSSIGAALDSGGWISAEGYEAATLLAPTVPLEAPVALGNGAMPLN